MWRKAKHLRNCGDCGRAHQPVPVSHRTSHAGIKQLTFCLLALWLCDYPLTGCWHAFVVDVFVFAPFCVIILILLLLLLLLCFYSSRAMIFIDIICIRCPTGTNLCTTNFLTLKWNMHIENDRGSQAIAPRDCWSALFAYISLAWRVLHKHWYRNKTEENV